jgi:transcription-repair coupling factor (superfamily II helicase)
MALQLPQENKIKQTWGQLYGCSLSLALADYCQQTPGVKLIVAPNNLTANQLLEELPFFLESKHELLLFPDWETLPYDTFSPHQDIISERLSALSRLQQSTNAIVITAASTLMHRLCPPSFLNQYGLVLKEGQTLDIAQFREQLTQAGYLFVNNVLEHGEFTVRGAIIDLFPMGSHFPFRIELFDNQVESLRRFNPENQRTIEKISHIQILPAREYPLDEQGITSFRRAFRTLFPGNPNQCPIYESVSKGQSFGGLEYYLPLFFEKTATFFDFLPSHSTICLVESTQESADQFWQELTIRHEQRQHNISRPLLAPNSCFLTPTELLTQINNYKQLRMHHHFSEKKSAFNFNVQPAPLLPIERQSPQPLQKLCDFMTDTTRRYLLIVESAGRREVLLDLLKQNNVYPKIQPSWQAFLQDNTSINITTGLIATGAELVTEALSIIVEAQLFGEQSTPQRRSNQKTIDPDFIIRDLAELRIGSPVVHLQFGVGRYLGLQTFENNGSLNEFLILSYAGDDKIYVPVTALNVISRYTGADTDHAPLHRLGSDSWQKEKKKAAEKIHDVAIELLDIYAKREAKPGHVYQFDKLEYQRFASGFPFTETIDQTNAINQIIQDMQSPRPMDRLICGDVGFGKTEVAMRAAFLAVQNGKQVCVLVPTTLLAGQHFESFRDRFAEFPIQIELLSRFRSAKESAQVIQTLQDGRTDIVIGTHKLFQKNIHFRDLGLLIIDEEHRFGVKQKEYIKSLRASVDILCMTATPIPRTLNMAMAGIRDISLITTPPAKRLAIKTFWQERNDSTLREAILREILRGGQVFFLHNNVQTINRICQELETLVPEAKISHAHGQMRERELERIMADFYHHRFNVLVCTTIIETGIDIPTANTIIIDRADAFGLAQLHQLRGRVGRSHHQAYAYLLTPDEKLLTPDAVKRLEAVVSLEELGAGFTLATHDLEIRGAGELLGEDQSGNMHAIGFNLFMEMLDRAVNDLKSGKIPELSAPMQQGPEIDLRISAIIPEDYIGDVHTRLIMYKRIANAKDKQQLHELQIELIDRFGLLRQPVKQLLLITELKFLATQLGVTRIQATAQQGKIEFSPQANINTAVLIQLIQLHSKRYQLEGPTRLKFTLDNVDNEERIHAVFTVLKLLQ